MPCSGPRHLPRAISASAVRAWASAVTSVTVMNAFSEGLRRSMRLRQARVSSTGDTFFERTSAATSVSDSKVRSSGGGCANALRPAKTGNAEAPAASARNVRRVGRLASAGGFMPRDYTLVPPCM